MCRRLQLRPKNAGYLPEAEFFEKTVGGVVVYSRFEIAVGDSLFAERVEGRSHQQAARTPGPVPGFLRKLLTRLKVAVETKAGEGDQNADQ